MRALLIFWYTTILLLLYYCIPYSRESNYPSMHRGNNSMDIQQYFPSYTQ